MNKVQNIYNQPWTSNRPDVNDPTFDLIKLEAHGTESNIDFSSVSVTSLEHVKRIEIGDVRKTAYQTLVKRSQEPFNWSYYWCHLFCNWDTNRKNKVNFRLLKYYGEDKSEDFLMTHLSTLHPKIAKHICLAGGAVSSIVLKGYVDDDQDYNFFVVGDCNPYKIVKKFSKHLLQIFDLEFFERKLNVSTLFLRHGNQKRIYKVQIIHKHYCSPSEVVNTFDLGSASACLYDGYIYLSKRGVVSFMTMTNIIDLDDRSRSYEYRLAKYGQRGFIAKLPLNTNIKHVLDGRETVARYVLLSEREKENYKISPLVNLLLMDATVKNGQSLAPYALSSYDGDKKDNTDLFKTFMSILSPFNNYSLKKDADVVFSYTTRNPYQLWKVSQGYLMKLGQIGPKTELKFPLKVTFDKNTAFQRQSMTFSEWSNPEMNPIMEVVD